MRVRQLAATALVGVVLVASGCSGDDDSDTPANDAPATEVDGDDGNGALDGAEDDGNGALDGAEDDGNGALDGAEDDGNGALDGG